MYLFDCTMTGLFRRIFDKCAKRSAGLFFLIMMCIGLCNISHTRPIYCANYLSFVIHKLSHWLIIFNFVNRIHLMIYIHYTNPDEIIKTNFNSINNFKYCGIFSSIRIYKKKKTKKIWFDITLFCMSSRKWNNSNKSHTICNDKLAFSQWQSKSKKMLVIISQCSEPQLGTAPYHTYAWFLCQVLYALSACNYSLMFRWVT